MRNLFITLSRFFFFFKGKCGLSGSCMGPQILDLPHIDSNAFQQCENLHDDFRPFPHEKNHSTV